MNLLTKLGANYQCRNKEVVPQGGTAIAKLETCSEDSLTPDVVKLLQGVPTPTSTHLMHTAHLALGWKVRAHPGNNCDQGGARPQAHLLFYLTGHRWDDPDPAAELLPCVRVVGIRDHGEGSVSAACRLEGSLGMCVTQLNVPPSWFTPPAPPQALSGAPPAHH
ncbi:transmembrane protein 132D [Salminus brasiliensis]|uniref:transmembrane protein 132D n=1 Tax=Salminus brasiliensis TaxID=930266 RepID=UPI003B839F1D